MAAPCDAEQSPRKAKMAKRLRVRSFPLGDVKTSSVVRRGCWKMRARVWLALLGSADAIRCRQRY